MTKAQSRRSIHQRNAEIVRRLRETSLTLEAVGAEFGLTRQRIQQIAKRAGISGKSRRRAIFSGNGNET
jgi:DNA-directed RNA polymerase sigma subunit (sigma70/sigma32)